MNLKLTLVTCALNISALAADTSPGPVAEVTNSPAQLPRIVVVAQKEPAEARSLPVSLTPVTSSTLLEADVRQVKQAEIYAPNVFINEFSARKLSNPYFRGIGSSPLNPGVTTYIDGVPQLNANSSSIELVDVDQIEFVRGPQGALFGRNTVGGLLNITSRRPSPLLESEADFEYGNYNYREGRATVSGPLSKGTTAVSVAGGYSARDGYTVNDTTGHDLDSREAFFGKGQFLWTPSEHWELRLLLSGERDRDGDYALGDLDRIRANPHHVLRNFEGSTERDITAPTLIAAYTDSAIDATMTAGLVWWETHDLTGLDLYPVPPVSPRVIRENQERDIQFTDEFRVASGKDSPAVLSDALSLRWQLGLSVFTQDYTQDAVNRFSTGTLYQPNQFFPGFPPFPSPANALHSPQSELNDVGVGAFAQATLVVHEKLDIGLGIHGDYEDKDADLNTFFAATDPILGPLGRPVHATTSRSFCEGSPMASLAWHATPEKTAYLAVGRGYKTGGFNPIAPLGYDAYGEESSWNYETGLKTSWCDNRVAFNIAAFYIHWQDLQLNLPNPNIVGQYYIANAGAADSKGVEAELHARPLAPWDLFLTGGYTDARFLSDSPAGLAGNHLIYSPDYTASAGTQYSLQVCRQAALYARAEIVAYGRFFYNPANTESQQAYTLANFRAGVRGSHWYVEGWVKNAFDTEYVPIALEFQNGGAGFVGESGAPATFGLRAGLNF